MPHEEGAPNGVYLGKQSEKSEHRLLPTRERGCV